MTVGIVTSSYPRFDGDYAGIFVEEMAKLCQDRVPTEVLAPQDARVDPERDRNASPSIRRFAPLGRVLPGPFYASGGPENLRNPLRWLTLPPSLLDLGREIGELSRRCRILVAHWLVPAGLVAAQRARPDTDLRTVVHGGDWRTLRASMPGRALARHVIRQSRDVLAVHETMRADLLSLFSGREAESMEERIRVCPMGIHVSDYAVGDLAARRDEGFVLAVGRLVPIKGFDRLIRAMEGLPVSLRIVGEGPEKERLKRLARTHGVHARFLGEAPSFDMPRLYAKATMAIIPSVGAEKLQEGFPRVALEAMAAGCPLAVSGSGGLKHLFKDGRNALVDDGDPGRLHRNVRDLWGRADLRIRLARQAQNDVLRYDWKAVFPVLMKL